MPAGDAGEPADRHPHLHFDAPGERPLDLATIPHAERLELLFAEISCVVRGRILRPALWRRLLSFWTGH
jgi:hypothetical protein